MDGRPLVVAFLLILLACVVLDAVCPRKKEVPKTLAPTKRGAR